MNSESPDDHDFPDGFDRIVVTEEEVYDMMH